MNLNFVTSAERTLDFAMLQQSTSRHAGRNRRVLWLMLGFLALLLGAVVSLLMYLRNFEDAEAARRRAADAQWLEQSVQFHFRRLEDDLLLLARHSAPPVNTRSGKRVDPERDLKTGLLWREPGVILSSGWIAAGQLNDLRFGPQRWQEDWLAHPENAQDLALMQTTSEGLRRSAYAGLMRRKDGTSTDVIWLAVPYFDRGQFAGNYLAAVSLERALVALVPDWFKKDHSVQLWADESSVQVEDAYRVGLQLPGTDVFVRVTMTQEQPTTVPRIFFLVALLFLLGMLLSLYALRRDFVKRQQMQALLEAQVALRSAMENSVTIGLRAWDLKGQILYVNEAFCRMVGYAAVDLIGRSPPFQYWPPAQLGTLERVHESIMHQGTSVEGVEVQFQHREGHLIDVLIHEAPLNTAVGEQIGWMSSVLDISERKRVQRMAAQQQEKLEASGRLVAIGEVASTLAHELNQPLGALSSFATGMLNRLHSGSISLSELLPVVERMAGLAERAGGIIKRVNAFARKRELSLQRFDMVVFLQRVLSQLGDVATPAPTWVLPDHPVWVMADELLLEHLVSNLVGNAQDWAAQAGRLPQVRVELEEDTAQKLVVFSVSDTGPGVSDEATHAIFNAFFTLKDGGMGMGLAICRSIVEAHSGRIDVSPDALLGGARFSVQLPLATFV